jgi:5-oxopent-3-ene-1,2,5-tricarboxylate decarboxylase/2-hydroxyhepta-2,4-diene-1,7-dioate isomerase
MAANLFQKATMSISPLPAALRGTVYGLILNDSDSLQRIGSALDAAPYLGAPRAPVLYIKPAGTWVGSGAAIALPAACAELEVGATIGLVIGKATGRLRADEALAAVAGYVLVADLSLPHSSYFRPAIQAKCFDRSCVMGAELAAAAALSQPAQLRIQTRINGELADSWSLDSLIRGVPDLICEVSEFMTLRAGDMLLVGVKWQAPRVRAGDRVQISCAGTSSLEFSITPTEAAA